MNSVSRESSAMAQATVRLRSMAMVGVTSRRSSSICTVSSPPLSGTARYARRISTFAKGKRSAVESTLNVVCSTAMPHSVAAMSTKGMSTSERSTLNTVSHTTVPMMLKNRWIKPMRRASRLAPMLEIMAVTQVPMFWPMMMGMAVA